MSLVIDASVALAWTFGDERTPPVIAILEDVLREGAVVPVLWRLEVANGLRSALRRGRITQSLRDATLVDMADLPITIDTETNDHAWSFVVALSDRYELTPYDAAYLELAQRRRVPLATLDRQLGEAAFSAGVAVHGLAR